VRIEATGDVRVVGEVVQALLEFAEISDADGASKWLSTSCRPE
jgi:hypothetical protein